MSTYVWLALIALCVYTGLYYAAGIIFIVPIAVRLGAWYMLARILGVLGK